MVTIVVEGDTDIPVVRKILELVDLAAGAVIDAGGKSKLDARLAAYNQAAKGSPWFILRDLDHDQPCAAALVEALVPASVRSELLCLRIAVREIESWLLADRSSIAKFLRVSPSLVPSAPDRLEDPTRTIVDLARKSTKPAIVRALVPRPGAGVSVGPEYEGKMIEFATTKWSATDARKNSESLERCIVALERLSRRIDR